VIDIFRGYACIHDTQKMGFGGVVMSLLKSQIHFLKLFVYISVCCLRTSAIGKCRSLPPRRVLEIHPLVEH
jgi:hypothetical protein